MNRIIAGTKNAIVAGILSASLYAPSAVQAQSLLVIPNLGSDAHTDFDLFGELEPGDSDEFWGTESGRILPGARIALGSGDAALYTEISAVHSGSWRFAVGTTLAVSSTEEEDVEQDTADDPNASNEALNRFVAGGGSLSLQGVRPILFGNHGTYTRSALLLVPRGWLNIPQLASTSGVDNYGAELAASLLLQRLGNRGDIPFLTLEIRGAWTSGSSAFYESIGRTGAKPFVYVAPTLTIRVQDEINASVSTFIPRGFEVGPAVRLSISLLNKDSD